MGTWEQRKFKELCDMVTVGIANSATHAYSDSGVVMFRNQNIKPNFLDDTDIIHINSEFEVKYKNKRLKKNDLLVARTGYPGTACVVPEKYENSQTFTTLIARPNENVDPYFLCQYLNSDIGIKYFESTQIGGGQKNSGAGILNEMPVTLPSTIEEEKQIADYFIQLDHLITLHHRKCEEMKILKKYMLQKMFPQNGNSVPEIRFLGFTEDWEQRKLGAVAEYRNGKAHENEIDDDGEYIVVNSKFVSTNGEIRKFSSAQNEPLYENEIAFVLSDVPNGRAIARTFLIDRSGKYTLNQRIAGITPHEDTDPYYLYIKMNRNAYFLKFDDGNKQTNLSIKDVLNYEDMYPSYTEQQKIGEYFCDLDHLITLHQKKCDELRNIKKFMLQNMFI